MNEREKEFPLVEEALKRMKRAHERGTGCHLTKEMIQTLSVTLIGQWWDGLGVLDRDD